MDTDDRSLIAALKRNGGRVQPTARDLEVPLSTLRHELTRRELWDAVKAARGGYTTGRPPTIRVDWVRFRSAWERAGRKVRPCALLLGVDRSVVVRLARAYKVAGAPRPRVRSEGGR